MRAAAKRAAAPVPMPHLFLAMLSRPQGFWVMHAPSRGTGYRCLSGMAFTAHRRAA